MATQNSSAMRKSASRALFAARNASRPTRTPTRTFATVNEPQQKDPSEFDTITELPNGLRVATESLPGPFSGVGVYVDAGSRYENQQLRGVSHIADRLAFKSTKSQTADQMLEAVETLGGNIQCQSSREALMYQSATFNSAVPSTIGILADTIRNPAITDEEVSQQLETADYEITEIWAKPELILGELVHMAAYKENTLGNPLLCPKERLPFINKSLIEKYRDLLYKPERMVVAFAGVQHEEALRLTEQYFGDMKRGVGPHSSSSKSAMSSPASATDSFDTNTTSSSSSSSDASVNYSSTSPGLASSTSKILSKIPLFKNLSTSASTRATVSPLDPSRLQPDPNTIDLDQPSHYTGGYLALPPLPPPPNSLSIPLSHFHIAFESPHISSPDIYALATLQTLLGGGGSFSAGGPGKGMYSRLYTHVLNQHGWIESCQAFNNSFTDSGIFGVAGTCAPDRLGHLIDVICRELNALTVDTGFNALQIAEVNRAKNQLRSALLMNLESRLVELEDLGRQVQVHGRKVGAMEMCRRIDALTVDDLRKVAREVFGGLVENRGKGTGAPTVVIQEGEEPGKGPLKQIAWEEVQDRIVRWKLGRR